MMPNVLLIYIVLCFVVGYLGHKSRLGVLRSVLLSFLLTPFIIFIYLLLFASLDEEKKSRSDRS